MQDSSIFQKYKYIKSLGKGGCGEVFLAENKILGNYWAVKEIPKDRNASVSGYIEPEILKRLSHPALPRICDVYEDEAKIYIIEDYIEGLCLQQELELKGKLEEQKTVELGIQLCSVLDYLHSQKPKPIIYGDIKPHNIILTKEGFVKLVDFGVASVLDNDSGGKTAKGLPAETTFIGTRGYAAPEQYTGAPVGPSADIYSLGITLIQLMTGQEPTRPTQTCNSGGYGEYMSPGLSGIIQKCIQSNPSHRYQKASLLMKELLELRLRNMVKPPGGDYAKRSTGLTKILALTGAKGTGVSTLTAAMAELLAKGSQTVCIADLSENNVLGYCFAVNKETNSAAPVRITSNLYYINLRVLTQKLKAYPNDHTDPLIIYKHFSMLQDQFYYILVDSDLSNLNLIEQFVNHTLLVCDMNPYNIAGLGDWLTNKAPPSGLVSEASIIVNKFYKGELSSGDILQSIFLHRGNEELLHKLISLSKQFEVPYDQRIYLKWMYSGFGEPLRFGSLLSDRFGKAISSIVAEVLRTPGTHPRSRFNHFMKGR